MSAIVEVKNRKCYSHWNYADETCTKAIIIPLIKNLEYIGKERCYYFQGYVDKDDDYYYIYRIQINDEILNFSSEDYAKEVYETIKIELEDFYKKYSDYVSIVKERN